MRLNKILQPRKIISTHLRPLQIGPTMFTVENRLYHLRGSLIRSSSETASYVELILYRTDFPDNSNPVSPDISYTFFYVHFLILRYT